MIHFRKKKYLPERWEWRLAAKEPVQAWKKNFKKFRNSRVSSLHIRLHILQSIKQNIDWKFWEGEGIAALHSRMSKMRKIQMAKHVNKKPQRISHRYNLMKWPLNSSHHWSLHHIIIVTMATSSKITNWAHKSTIFFFWWQVQNIFDDVFQQCEIRSEVHSPKYFNCNFENFPFNNY